MEHIVQFAIGIDDAAIEKRIMETAEQQIINSIRHDIENHLFTSRYGSVSGFAVFAERIIEEWLDDHKSEIIDKAAVHLAEKLSRTKAAKEMLSEVVSNG